MSRIHISEINALAEELNDDSLYEFLHNVSSSFENGGNEGAEEALRTQLRNYSPERRKLLYKILLGYVFSKADLEFLEKYLELSNDGKTAVRSYQEVYIHENAASQDPPSSRSAG